MYHVPWPWTSIKKTYCTNTACSVENKKDDLKVKYIIVIEILLLVFEVIVFMAN